MAVIRRVSLMADHASGSFKASKNASKPFRNASVNTAAKGSIKNKPTKTKATPMRVRRSHTGSPVLFKACVGVLC